MVHPGASVGCGTRIWANANILEGAVIGDSDISAEDLKNIENHLHRPEIGVT